MLKALAIYAKSPSAYHAVKALGILNLPCDKTIKGHMSKDSRSPGINEEALMMRAEEYKTYKDEREQHGFVRPVSEGVLIWDEVKVFVYSCFVVIALIHIIIYTGAI